MAKFKENNYKFWHSPFALIILFCVVVLFGYNIVGLFEQQRETANKKEIILEKIDDLKQKESTLSLELAKLATEEGKEEIIRDKYQVAKAGEKMVIIVNEDEDERSSMVENKPSHGFWNWVKNLFSKK